MIRKSTLAALCLIISAPVQAGGLLSDIFIKPPIGAAIIDRSTIDAGKALERAASDTGKALEKAASDAGKPAIAPNVSQSKTCVTPRGSCEISNSLNGTTCFCGDAKDAVFGRVQ